MIVDRLWAACLSLLVVACSPATSQAGAAGGSGCGNANAPTGDFTLHTAVDGVDRSSEVVVGSGYTPTTPVPVAFVFHGINGTSADAKGYGLQVAAANAGNPAIFVFPQAVTKFSYGVGFDTACTSNDVAFFDALRKQLASQYCIDPARVFVAGFSDGGDFTNALGCCRGGNAVLGIAPASGGFYNTSCVAPPPAFRLTSGTADPFYSQSEFDAGVRHFQAASGCSTTSASVNPAPCQGFARCAQPVVWCSYDGMGHQLPPNWATDTWSFLAGLPSHSPVQVPAIGRWPLIFLAALAGLAFWRTTRAAPPT